MGRDIGEVIGMIAVGAGAFVLVLSYLGAYMLGRGHGRREEQRSSRYTEAIDAGQRLSAVESTIRGLSASVERLMDAQRLLVAQQDHLSRKIGSTERKSGAPRPMPTTNTPS